MWTIKTSYLDFFRDFAVRGEILGAGLGSEPAEWVAALGNDFSEGSPGEGQLALSFGLVEAYFADHGSGTWACDTVSVRVFKLRLGMDVVPDAVRARYGTFPHRVRFDDIADRAHAAGASVHQVTRIYPAALEHYWIPEGDVSFWVVSEGQANDVPGLAVGDVYSADRAVDLAVEDLDRTRYR